MRNTMIDHKMLAARCDKHMNATEDVWAFIVTLS